LDSSFCHSSTFCIKNVVHSTSPFLKKKILEDFEIRLAKGESIRSISALHGIQPAQYRSWKGKKVAISSARKQTHKAVTCGRGSRIRHLKEELVQWMLNLREQGIVFHYKYVVERVAQ
jgi:DNA transposition AAA+ family ATPase